MAAGSGDRTRRAIPRRPAELVGFDQTVADRLGMPGDDAIQLADDCARDGLVMHDQSQHTKADRRAAVQPHSVTLAAPGWALVRK